MSIAHELSSDVAAAVLAHIEEPLQDRNELVEVVMEVHSTLQELSEEARHKTRRAPKQAETRLRSRIASAD